MGGLAKVIIGQLTRSYDLSVVRARSLFRASLFLFSFVAGVTAFKISTNVLFLSRRNPADLPYLYLATAVVITVVTVDLGRRLGRHSAKPVLKASVLVAAGVLGLLTLLGALDVPLAFAALYVAGEVYATAISVLFWARLGEVFDVRTAKRVFGAVAAAGMGGAVLGGVMVRSLAQVVPSLAWCAFAVGTLLVIRPLLGAGRAKGHIQRRTISFRDGLAYAAVDRFPRSVALLVLVLAVQTAAVDYVFRTGAVAAEQGDEAALAGLFGTLNAVVGVGAIAFQVLLTGPLLKRVGVFIFLSVVPVASIFAATWALAVPAMFAPIFLLKTFEMMGSLSLNQPALQLLYNPMPTAMRDAVRALVDGSVKKVGAALGGGLLIFFGALFDRGLLLAVVLALAAAILLWIRVLRRGYLAALGAKLSRKRGMVAVTIDPSDRATLETLVKALQDPDPGKALAALSVLAREPSVDLGPHFAALIAHRDEDVRAKALQLLRQAPKPAYGPRLAAVIRAPDDRPKAEAARALELVDPALARQTLAPLLRDPPGTQDLGLVSAAISALLHGEDAGEARRAAEGALEELFAHGRRGPVEERQHMARLLGDLGPGPHAARLAAYLDDPEPSVRRLALESAASARHPALLPKLLAALADRRARRAAMTSMAAYGDLAVPLLAEALDDRRIPVELRVHLPKVLRRIRTEAAGAAMLFSNVQDDAFLRFVIIQELSRLRRERPDLPLDHERAEAAALRRLRAYAHYRPMAADLAAAGPAFVLLRRAVEDRVTQNLQAALRVLGLVYGPAAMENALFGLMKGAYADAVELLDVTLQGSELRSEVLAAVEQSLPTGVAGRARERAFALVEGRDVQLAMIAWETLRRLGEDPPEVREPTHGEPLMPKSIVDRVFLLESVQLFHGLGVDDLAAVAAVVTEGHADPGQVIYRQGDPGDSMYILVSGEVHLLKNGQLLMDLYQGDSFGQVSILDGGARPVSAKAGDEGVDYLCLEREPFMDLLADRQEVVNGLFVVLARRLRELVELTGAHAAGTMTTAAQSQPSLPAVGVDATARLGEPVIAGSVSSRSRPAAEG